MPASFERAHRFLDLADFLGYRATGNDARSLCTTACKWTYLGHAQGWDESYFQAWGWASWRRAASPPSGDRCGPWGERAGGLTEAAAAELGLAPGTAVAIGIIDAHAGGLGLLGAPLDDGGEAPNPRLKAVDGSALTAETLEERVALIGGTSTCHMAVSREPKFVRGVWGPYWSAMVPGLWLTEGGQSATARSSTTPSPPTRAAPSSPTRPAAKAPRRRRS